MLATEMVRILKIASQIQLTQQLHQVLVQWLLIKEKTEQFSYLCQNFLTKKLLLLRKYLSLNSQWQIRARLANK
jgi:hypothetical protein